MRRDTTNDSGFIHSDRHRHDTQKSHSLRLKCIVLGSSAAGKTSILRRYIHGTFEDQGGGYSPFRPISSGRGTVTPHASTLGADYYVKKVNNPLFESGATSSGHNNTQKHKISQESHILLQLWDTVGTDRPSPLQFLNPRMRKRHRHQSSYNNSQHHYQFFLSHSSTKCLNRNSISEYHEYSGSASRNHTLLQNYHSSHLCVKEKTRVYTNNHAPNAKHHYPHNRRLTSRRTTDMSMKSNFSQAQNEPVKNALFKNVDACMLVYDATSSMSFLQLMDWHEELIRRWTTQYHDGRGKHNHKFRNKQIPFIVVANKIDILNNRSDFSEGDNGNGNKLYKQCASKRRSVMGFGKNGYVGEGSKYEYSAENNEFLKSCHKHDDKNELNQSSLTTHHSLFQSKPVEQPSDQLLSSKSSSPKTNPSKETPTERSNKLTYSLKNTTWTTDTFYLEALQLAEDQLPANRPLILLWCQRNGIPHFEASALDGRGVDEAMQHLIWVGVNELKKREMGEIEVEPSIRKFSNEDIVRVNSDSPEVERQDLDRETFLINESSKRKEISTNILLEGKFDADGFDEKHRDPTKNASTPSSQHYFLYQPRYEEKLDLFARYSAKDEKKCFPFHHCWSSLFSKCRR